MSYAIYTPAYNRLQENPEYKCLQAEYDAWMKRPTVVSQNETDQDGVDWTRITDAIAKLEWATGHGGYGGCPYLLQRTSSIPQLRGFSTAYCFEMTQEELGVFLQEYRAFLRGVYWSLIILKDRSDAGDYTLAMRVHEGNVFATPFQSALLVYKTFCRAFRLGEGCWIG